MEDQKIIGLFFQRDESALFITQKKYGKILSALARRITGNETDAEECLNDTLLGLWNHIPPANPQNLRAYACKVIRNLAFKRLSYNLAEKRSVNSQVSLDELEASLSDGASIGEFENVDFSVLFNSFLRELKPESRVVFLKRYYFLDSEAEIAADLGMSLSKVKALLFRARKKFKNDIYKEVSEK